MSYFDQPNEVYSTPDLAYALEKVAAELTGSEVFVKRLLARQMEFFTLLSDARSAGNWVALTLADYEWDWPRWQSHAADLSNEIESLPRLRVEANQMSTAYAIDKLTIEQLKSILLEQGLETPAKPKKIVLQTALLALPLHVVEAAARRYIDQWLTKKSLACRQRMGAAIASRVVHIAHARYQLRSRSAPKYLAILPYWEFKSPSDAPKACRKLNGKILLADQALHTFPELPCARLNCVCRITSVRGC